MEDLDDLDVDEVLYDSIEKTLNVKSIVKVLHSDDLNTLLHVITDMCLW
jgi:hypothetical protein